MVVKKLVIVESPNKCKKIQEYLGSEYIVEASVGNIREISDLSCVDIENGYKISYKISKEKTKVVENLKKIASKCDEVLLGTDDDRAGTLIAWHIAKCLNLDVKNTKRLVFQEITKKALQTAIKNPSKIDMDAVYSQQCREVLDLLIGFEISPLLWKNFVGRGLSAGRCQSPAVLLVYEREKEIAKQNNIPQFSISVNLIDKDKSIEFPASFTKKVENNEIVNDIFQKIMNNGFFKIESFVAKKTEHKPSNPFITSTIQQEASNILGMKPKETMDNLQHLFSNGKITYMRTDSIVLSEDAMNNCEEYIKTQIGDQYHKRTIYKNKNSNAQEAHEAIRPTHIDERELIGDDFTDRQKRLYDLIWKRTVASQMAPEKATKNIITINFYYYTSNNVFVIYNDKLESQVELTDFQGYKILYNSNKNKDNGLDIDLLKKVLNLENLEKDIKKRPKLYCKSAIGKEEYHRSIGRFTESSLVAELERLGIGRPSTYASLMTTIVEKGYVENKDHSGVEKQVETITLNNIDKKISNKTSKTMLGKENKKLTITPLGEQIIPFLLEHFSNIMDYKFTSRVNDELDEIMNRSKTYLEVVSKFHNSFHPIVLKLQQQRPVIINNNNELNSLGNYNDLPIVLRDGKFGHFLTYNGNSYSLKYIDKTIQNEIIKKNNLEKAIEVIENMDKKRKMREENTYIVGPYEITLGPHGYYFKDTKGNMYSIGNNDPNTVTEIQCNIIIQTEKDRKKFLKIKKSTDNNNPKKIYNKKPKLPPNGNMLASSNDDYY